MPVIFRIGPYAVLFYSGDKHEPPHVHVDRDDSGAKFWLNPVRRARHHGYSPMELRRILKLVRHHEMTFLEEWHDFFETKE